MFKNLVLLTAFFVTYLPVKKHSWIHETVHYVEKNDYDNGYSRARYDEVLDAFLDEFSDTVAEFGGELKIQRDWGDGAVNAWAWKIGREFILEVPGGLSRYHLINEPAFVSVVCHELGHLIGGAPASRYNISFEGQSDYYASQKCVRRIVHRLNQDYLDLTNAEVEELCSRKLGCRAAVVGALAVTSYYASLANAPAPTLTNRDRNQAQETLASHPDAQCRLDTLVASALCPVEESEQANWDDPTVSYCHAANFPQFQRPRCWYRAPGS